LISSSSESVSSSSEIALSSSSAEIAESSSSEERTAIAQLQALPLGYSVSKSESGYAVRFDRPGNYHVFVMNSMGQLMARKVVRMGSEVQIQGLPKGNYLFKIVER
jgi:arabinan endo-1,5-alpha-L-arabinosidase